MRGTATGSTHGVPMSSGLFPRRATPAIYLVSRNTHTHTHRIDLLSVSLVALAFRLATKLVVRVIHLWKHLNVSVRFLDSARAACDLLMSVFSDCNDMACLSLSSLKIVFSICRIDPFVHLHSMIHAHKQLLKDHNHRLVCVDKRSWLSWLVDVDFVPVNVTCVRGAMPGHGP